MKKIFIILTLVLFIDGCTNPSNNPSSKPTPLPPSPKLSEECGGISSGGGGTLPADPSSTWEIEQVIHDAKRDLRMYFRNELVKIGVLGHDITDTEKKIYFSKYTILDALENSDLTLQNDKPCYDKNGREVDGSIVSDKPNTICISSFRIAPKVPKELARNEVIALIAHELAHLVGLNENEAVQFQKDSLFYLKYGDRLSKNEERTKEMTDRSYDNTYLITNQLGETAKKIDSLNFNEILKSLEKIMELLRPLKFGDVTTFSIFNFEQYSYFDVQNERILMGLWFTLSQSDEPDAPYWKDQIEEIFKTDSTLTFREYNIRRNFPSLHYAYPNEIIKKIQTIEDLKKLLLELESYFREISNYSWALRWNQPLPVLQKGPWYQPKENPWKNFLGSYTVIDRQCKLLGFKDIYLNNIKEIMIHYPSYNSLHLYLRRIWENAWADDGIEENDMHDGITYVAGDNNKPLLFQKRGNSWENDIFETTFSFERSQDKIIWNAHIESISRYDLHKKLNTVDCLITLQEKK